MKRWGIATTVALAALLATLAAYRLIQAPGGIQGIVYADSNANGVQDAGEAGIPDVAVSNGRDVVLSDSQGRYRLPADTASSVFVIKPPGFSLPRDGFAKPRFYHHLDKAIGTTRTKAPSHDFPLRPLEAPGDEFSILVFGDPQPDNERQVGYYARDIIADVEAPGEHRFGLTLGDIVGNKPALFEPVARATAHLDIPWWYVIGNHDLVQQARDPGTARQPYVEFFGPTVYAFNEGQVHFIVLDDIAWKGPKANNFVGGLDDRQLAFIEADLQHVPEDRLVVLAMHIPPLGEWAFKGMFRLEDRKRLFDLLAGRKVLSLAAHAHGQWRLDFDDAFGWPEEKPHHLYIVGTAGGDMWSGKLNTDGLPDATMRDGTPNGYAIIRFRGTRYEMDWKAAGHPASYRMRIHGPAMVDPAADQAHRFFYVNYFMGYYGTRHVATPVEYREPGGQWQPMVPSFEADPYRIALEFPWLEAHWRGEKPPAGNRPHGAVPSLHLWKAEIPVHGPPGERRLEIRVTDNDGRRFFGEYRYQVKSADQANAGQSPAVAHQCPEYAVYHGEGVPGSPPVWAGRPDRASPPRRAGPAGNSVRAVAEKRHPDAG